jgi:enhancer of polycomb-like protein
MQDKAALNLASTQLAVSGLTAKKPKVKEIPVPQVNEVPTYTRDYLPTFRIPETYIRARGK